GQFRGSPAYQCIRQTHHANGPLLTQLWNQALRYPLHGYRGGRSACGNYALIGVGSDEEQVVTTIEFEDPAENGDQYLWLSAGGGGWGDPLDRDARAVLDDVLDELVSIEGARLDYGVVIDPVAWLVDDVATAAERERLRNERAANPDWLAWGRRRVLERT